MIATHDIMNQIAFGIFINQANVKVTSQYDVLVIYLFHF